MNFKAILFDAGDVLYHRPRRGEHLAAFLNQLGLPFQPEYRVRTDQLKWRAYSGEHSKRHYQTAILELCGVPDGAACEDGLRVLDHEQADIELFNGVVETLHHLKSQGLLLGIVTNTYNRTAEKLGWFRHFGIDGLWDAFITSCEVGLCKPDPRIYEAALNRLKVGPSEAAFVGHAARELEGAKIIGLTTVAFNRDNAQVTADDVIPNFPDLIRLLKQQT